MQGICIRPEAGCRMFCPVVYHFMSGALMLLSWSFKLTISHIALFCLLNEIINVLVFYSCDKFSVFFFQSQGCNIISESFIILYYYMACVCSRYNVHSDWLIVTEL